MSRVARLTGHITAYFRIGHAICLEVIQSVRFARYIAYVSRQSPKPYFSFLERMDNVPPHGPWTC
jgi:hypothetical protein